MIKYASSLLFLLAFCGNIYCQDSFDLNFKIVSLENHQFAIVADLKLADESYVVSPYSKDEVYGHFELSMVGTNRLIFDGRLLEIPDSKEEYDSILNETVRFIRQNTIFKQPMKLLGKEDFEVKGMVWFVLEPQCIPYDIEFLITYKEGKMSIEKTKTAISKGYKK